MIIPDKGDLVYINFDPKPDTAQQLFYPLKTLILQLILQLFVQ